MELWGGTALVLGAGGGLGRAIAIALAREGVNVALGDIDEGALAATATAVQENGAQGLPIVWDITDIDAAAGHARAVLRSDLSDILINNTGGPSPGTAQGVPPDTWRAQFNAMVLAVIAPHGPRVAGMRARKWGRIVTSTSSGVVSPIPNLAVSNALRMSLVGWSKTLAPRGPRPTESRRTSSCRAASPTGRIRFLDEQKAKRENRSLESVIAESTDAILPPVATESRRNTATRLPFLPAIVPPTSRARSFASMAATSRASDREPLASLVTAGPSCRAAFRRHARCAQPRRRRKSRGEGVG